ncbi:MAG TPA: FAD-dependent oxidoreductase, partial [Solirubrobacterales bacterium]|nr:FAD-dependent oxidoreductase [Solirubrobacterales bacterium]
MGSGRRAAVVGAGIGGLASAIALARAGWEVTVYEANPEHRPLGAGLSLWPNGVRAMRWLGLGELVEESLHQAGGVRRADGRML